MADSRTRNWTMIGYPGDSLPENYREILNDQLHLSWCESPVHDADVNGNGEEKNLISILLLRSKVISPLNRCLRSHRCCTVLCLKK